MTTLLVRTIAAAIIRGSGQMPTYRVYWLGADGHIKAALNVDCASDQEARKAAVAKIGAYPAAEIWEGTRRVMTVHNPNPARVIDGVFSAN